MKLAKDRFYKSDLTMSVYGGGREKYDLYTYETENALYDVAVSTPGGPKLYRKNMGRWSYTPEKIHLEISKHYNIPGSRSNPSSGKRRQKKKKRSSSKRRYYRRSSKSRK